MQVLPKEHSVA